MQHPNATLIANPFSKTIEQHHAECSALFASMDRQDTIDMRTSALFFVSASVIALSASALYLCNWIGG